MLTVTVLVALIALVAAQRDSERYCTCKPVEWDAWEKSCDKCPGTFCQPFFCGGGNGGVTLHGCSWVCPPPPSPSSPPDSPSLPPSPPAPPSAPPVDVGSIVGPVVGAVIVIILAAFAYKYRAEIKAKVAEVELPKLPSTPSLPSMPSLPKDSPKPQPKPEPAKPSGPGTTVIAIDTDGDGQLDSVAVDTDGDGKVDTVIPMAPKPAPQPAPVPVFMGTIVDPAAVQPEVEPSQEETPEEVTSTVELVRTPLGLGLSIDGRNKVTAIDDDSQAGRSGLIELHDRLVSINGQPLSSLVSPEVGTPLEELLGAIEVGGTMSIEIARVPRD